MTRREIAKKYEVGRGSRVAARAVSLGLEERRQRLAERHAAVLAAAITDGLRRAFGDLATVERRTVFADVVERRLLVLETLDAEELERLRQPTPTSPRHDVNVSAIAEGLDYLAVAARAHDRGLRGGDERVAAG